MDRFFGGCFAICLVAIIATAFVSFFLLLPVSQRDTENLSLFSIHENRTSYVSNNTRFEVLNSSRIALYLKHSSDEVLPTEGPCCTFLYNSAHWVTRNEPYRIYQPPSSLFVNAIVDSGQLWTAASNGISVLGTGIESGRTFSEEELVQIDKDERNFVAEANLDWLGDSSILAVARLIMDPNLRHIYQWGIIVNTQQNIGDAVHNPDSYDLRSIMNHEVGHVYGLGHQEGCPNNIMFPYLAPGTTRGRQLDYKTKACVSELYDSLPVDGEVDEISAGQSIGWSVALHLIFILFV